MDKTVKGTGVGILVGIGTPIIIKLVGFTKTGVAAHSIAAGIHGVIGNVTAGSTFATLQSSAATGAITTVLPYVVVIGAEEVQDMESIKSIKIKKILYPRKNKFLIDTYSKVIKV